MATETVPVQDDAANNEAEVVVQEQQVANEVVEPQPSEKEEHVPLSALQKERRKRQEAEEELRWHKEQAVANQAVNVPEPDESRYEAATKEDLGKVKLQVIREVQESNWIKNNPEKAAEINDKLTEFLKQRPNLAAAIEAAQNRYEEAWELMDKLTPKQKLAMKPAAKKETPGNPAGIPKAAALNEAINFSSMSDAEFNAWRKSQRKSR